MRHALHAAGHNLVRPVLPNDQFRPHVKKLLSALFPIIRPKEVDSSGCGLLFAAHMVGHGQLGGITNLNYRIMQHKVEYDWFANSVSARWA